MNSTLYDLFVKYSLLFCLITSFLMIFPVSISVKLVYYTFEEKINRSDIIIHGKVKKIKKRLFGENSSFIDISRIITGQYDLKQIEIKYGRKNIFFAKEDDTSFEIGKEYILFLRKQNSGFKLVGAHQGCFSIRENGTILLNNKYIDLQQFISEIQKIKNQSEP